EKLNEHFAQLSLWGASRKLPLSLAGVRAQLSLCTLKTSSLTSLRGEFRARPPRRLHQHRRSSPLDGVPAASGRLSLSPTQPLTATRSEERRVGKGGRA